MEYWKILLEEHRKNGKSGLTIPFILGSQQFLSGENIKQNIRDLIIDIVNNDPFETCIRYCFNIKTLIIEIKKKETPVVYPKFRKRDQKNLSISIFNKDLGESVEEIIEKLTSYYQKKIDSGFFSVKENDYGRISTWGDFSEIEKQFITESFKKINSI